MATTDGPAEVIKGLRVYIVHEEPVIPPYDTNNYGLGWTSGWKSTFGLLAAAAPLNTTRVVEPSEALALMLASPNSHGRTDLWVVDASLDQVKLLKSVYLSSVNKATIGLYELKMEDRNPVFVLVTPPTADE